MALDVINVNQMYKIDKSSLFLPKYGLKYISFSHNARKGIWSAYIGRATTPSALTGAIPLLLGAGTLNCWISPLARIAPH